MKTLILGAAGQLGKQLIAAAPKDCVCFAKARHDLDVTDQAAVMQAVCSYQPSLILNAAAYTAVDRAEQDPVAAYAVNAAAVQNLAHAAATIGSHLVHVSTNFVFDGRASEGYLPDHPRRPLSVYGRTKAAGEDAAGPNSSVVRTSWVYSAGEVNFVTAMLRLMRDNAVIRVVVDEVAAPTWAPALAETIWFLGMNKIAGRWHYSDAGVASRYDFAVAIAEDALAIGLLPRPSTILPIRASEYSAFAPRPAFSLLDSERTRHILARPPVHWRVNLRRMLEAQLAYENATSTST